MTGQSRGTPSGSAHPGAAVSRVRPAFRHRYGQPPALVWSAPGRVNLIGEHTDYNDGFVLPFALSQRTAVAAARSGGPEWTVWSEATGRTATFGNAELTPGRVTGWAAYPAGVIWALRQAGIEVPGARIALASDVPLGAGLSSSAALECALLAVMLDLAGAVDAVPRSRWPELAQRAESDFVGVPCGIMDQSAAVWCRDGQALFLDCQTQATEHVPLDLAGAGLAMLLIDTRAPHRLIAGEYAARRTTCAAAARALGVPALREVNDLPEALAALPDEDSRRLVRHVVTENERVLGVVRLLRAGRTADIGPLLSASHRSLKDDYQVTVPELDVAAAAAEWAGALGARITGAGFGGCVITLAPAAAIGEIGKAVAWEFAARGFAAPATFLAVPSGGVARLPDPPGPVGG